MSELPAAFLGTQLDTVASDIYVAAVKTGALVSADLVSAAAAGLRRHGYKRVVVDPVAVSKHGDPLLAPEGVAALREELLPLAEVVTPNLEEARLLSGVEIGSTTDMHRAAEAILAMGPRWVLVKGGDLPGNSYGHDLLTDGIHSLEIRGHSVDSPHTHGTGCTLAATITAQRARGCSMPDAVHAAKRFVTGALRHGFALGDGNGPVDLLWERDRTELTVRPGVAIVLRNADGRVLLHRRRVGGGWAPPSGAVEAGEDLHHAAHREVAEETSLSAHLDQLVAIYSDPAYQVVEYPDGRRVHFVTTVFDAHVTEGALQGSDEGEEWAWFLPDNLPEDLLSYARVWLSDALGGTELAVR